MAAITKKIKTPNSQQWRLYEFLKRFCVGQDMGLHNNEQDRQLLANMNIGVYTSRQMLQEDTRVLRLYPGITRRIVVDPIHGTYLPKSVDEESTYMKNLTIAYVKNSIIAGDISANELYKVLNDQDEAVVIDKNQRIKLSKYQNSETRKYSEDLA